MRILKRLLHFPLFWYQDAPNFFFPLFRKITLYIDQNLAVSLMAKMMFTPVFEDYTFTGRAISLFFRLFRVAMGLALIAVANLSLVAVFILWLVFPVWLLLHWQFLGGLALAVFALIYAFWAYDDPIKKLSQIRTYAEVESVMNSQAFEVWSVLSEREQRPLFLKLLRTPKVREIFWRLGLAIEEIQAQAAARLSSLPVSADDLTEGAYSAACRWQADYLGPEHFLVGLYEKSAELQGFFKSLKVDWADLQQVVGWLGQHEKDIRPRFLWDPTYSFGPLGGINRGWTGRLTPTLDQYSRDLTSEAQAGSLFPMVGREKEVSEAVRILSRSLRNNVLLLGPPGSGKTTLVTGIAQEIARGTLSPSLRFKRVVSLDVTALVAGTKTPGDLDERLVRLLSEIKGAGNVILFVDEIHTLTTAVGTDPGASPLLNAFLPHLAAGEFQFIGATSQEAYHKYLEPHASFARVFQVVSVPEASEKETIEILKRLTWGLEAAYRGQVQVSLPAIRAVVRLTNRYLPERVLPDKAVDVLDEALVKVKDEKRRLVTARDIEELISARTKVPVTAVSGPEAQSLLSLEGRLHQRLVDQEEAVASVADALRRTRVGLREEKRPVASFLFVGPTGVGKTETARTLAEVYYGSEKNIVRLDMGEFNLPQSVTRLVGPAPGQPEAGLGGQLTEAIRQRPFSLILLDELEKAHPQVWQLFLPVLEDGQLSDGQGRVVDFSQTIIIATSNVGTEMIRRGTENGLPFVDLEKGVWEALEEAFPSEFLNRFSKVVVFKPLTLEEVAAIARLRLDEIAGRTLSKGISLDFTPDLVKLLAQRGFSPSWGARPLRRLLEEKIEAPLAKMILAGKLAEGDHLTIGPSFLGDV